MTTTYGANTLPDVDWEEFVKTAPTRMCRIAGPCTIYTLEGPLDMPAGWEGWLAVDSKGHPYPIDDEVHSSTYQPADVEACLGRAPRIDELFDDAQLDVFDEIRQGILDNEAATGSWTTKAEARQTGCSLHIKYEKRTDVLGGSSMFIKIMEDSPGKLFWIMDKLLTAVGRPLSEED